MPTNAIISARIDKGIKEEASAVLAAAGLSVSDACRIVITRIAKEKTLRFGSMVLEIEKPRAKVAPLTDEEFEAGLPCPVCAQGGREPNAVTLAAMEEARTGRGEVTTIEEMRSFIRKELANANH
jgi:addiction module RelB/DinJ family antitoxin